ncbi:TENA/THI-4/PQQC family domain-containing protein [Ditylenchus destructor]|uniref:TENA/THI-4/PQQC family domain-containing protein n=1 Tax=Ditylenchus destructor TaxID=166010 RepID=A0AAD4MRM4_9BILA|nr:TENA/THI-4/PQQC family domain-containing protein [Ditylenchus destructor]
MANPIKYSFSEEAWNRNKHIIDAIFEMPFITELQSGKLSEERFRHYIIQDAHYLKVYGRVLALASAKSANSEHAQSFLADSARCVNYEEAGLQQRLLDFGVDAHTFAKTEQSAACNHYTSFLMATGFNEGVEVLGAAVLPCYWIYREVGKWIAEKGAVDTNPYKAWIDMYSAKTFSDTTNLVIQRTDAMAISADEKIHEAMHDAFKRAAQLEFMFWDSAYKLEQWKI